MDEPVYLNVGAGIAGFSRPQQPGDNATEDYTYTKLVKRCTAADHTTCMSTRERRRYRVVVVLLSLLVLILVISQAVTADFIIKGKASASGSSCIQEEVVHTTMVTELTHAVQTEVVPDSVPVNYTTMVTELTQKVQTEVVPASVPTKHATMVTELTHTVQSSAPTKNSETKNTEESLFVGFTAWKSITQEYQPGDTVIYEEVTLNEGGHYTPSTGRFHCPVSGVYFAHITGRVYNTDDLQLQIVKNDEICGNILEYGARLPYNTLSNGCLMECSAGESIQIKAIYSSSVYGDQSVPYSTFSVLLINQLAGELLPKSFDGSTGWKPRHQTYSTGDVIRFPNVHYNQPGSYLPALSKYVCRKNGIYLVMVTVMKYAGDPLNIGVEHDSYTVMSLSDNEADNDFNTIHNSVLLRCETNQTITVKATGSGKVNGESGYDYTSSTVIMMNQEDSDKYASFVGCSVSKSAAQSYVSEETITYDGIAVNIGGLFNPTTSQFVCQTEAVYYVTATARKASTTDLQIDIMHGSTILFRLEDLGSANPNNTVSNSAVVRCTAGEVIQVKAAGSGTIYGSTEGIFTTFNVMKIS